MSANTVRLSITSDGGGKLELATANFVVFTVTYDEIVFRD